MGREKFDRSYNCKLLVQGEFGIRRGHKTRAFLSDTCQPEVFFILEFLDDTKFVLLSFFTLVKTIFLKHLSK